MSSFTKGFKKITKSVSKAANTVAQTTTSTANTVAQGTTSTANTVASSVSSVLSADTIKKIKSQAETSAAALEDAAGDAWDKIDDQVEKWLTEAAFGKILKHAKELYAKNKDQIVQARAVLTALKKSGDASSAIGRIVDKASLRQHDSAMITDVKKIAANSDVTALVNKIKSSQALSFSDSSISLRSIFIGMGANAALVGGAEASLGSCWDVNDAGNAAAVFSIGALGGAAVGAAGDFQLGFMFQSPQKVGGAYLAAEFIFADGEGGGVEFTWDLPTTVAAWDALCAGQTDATSIIVCAVVGAEAEASIKVGCAWTF